MKLSSLKVSLKNKKTFEFSKKISYLGTFCWDLKKNYIAIFEISTLQFFNMRRFMQK